MRLVGLTGGIACGKSSVSVVLADEGIEVLDLDELAREAVVEGSWGYRRVVRAFGRDVLAADGSIDRAKLGEVAFGDPEARRRLNRATHPPIFAALVRAALARWWRGVPLLVLDAPLLYESGLWRVTPVRVAVCASPNVQRARLEARDDLSPEAAAQRVAAQAPVAEKARRSQYVIWNDGGREELERKAKWLAAWLKSGAKPEEAVRETRADEEVVEGVGGPGVEPDTVSQWGGEDISGMGRLVNE